jgi:hypothetical protein
MNRRIAISAWAHALVLPGIALGASKVEQQAEVRKAAQDALNGLYKAQPLRTYRGMSPTRLHRIQPPPIRS